VLPVSVHFCLPFLSFSRLRFTLLTTSPHHRSSTFRGSTTQSIVNISHDINHYANMNWTGGRLQRHSKNNAKSTDLARQKQHFAAVRQRLQNGQTVQGTPFRPSCLNHGGLALGNGVTPFGQGLQRHTGHPKRKQAKLDDYSSTAPVARRLASMQKRPVTSRNPPGRQQEPSSANPRSDETESPQLNHEETSRGGSSLRIRRDATSASSQYSASRKRNRSKLWEEYLLELSRKKLLLQNDWIGLAHSRPMQMTFTSCQGKERIGKRRKIDNDIEVRQRMFGKMKQVNNDYGDVVTAQPSFMSGTLGVVPESISVRIGNLALSTQVSVAPHKSLQFREDLPQVRQLSESMLFDVEQRELAQPQKFRLVGGTAEQESRFLGHAHEQEASSSSSIPLCDTETSESSSSASDDEVNEPEPVAQTTPPPVDQSLEVGQLLNQLDGQGDSFYEQKDIEIDYPGPPVKNCATSPPHFRLAFESSSVLNDTFPSERLPVPFPENDVREATDQFQFQPSILLFEIEKVKKADVSVPNIVNIHVARPGQCGQQDKDEIEEMNVASVDDDTAWKRFFSLASSNSALYLNEVDPAHDLASGSDTPHSRNASLATTRDADFTTLKPAQSLRELESSVSVHNSPPASLRHITSLIEQPFRTSVEEPKQNDPNEFWRKFVFDDDDDTTTLQKRADSPPPQHSSDSSLYVGPASTHIDPPCAWMSEKALPSATGNSSILPENESDPFFSTWYESTGAAQPAASAWSGPKHNNRSTKTDLAFKSTMKNDNTSSSDASLTFRARADPKTRDYSYRGYLMRTVG
jgi:hypothetical protein